MHTSITNDTSSCVADLYLTTDSTGITESNPCYYTKWSDIKIRDNYMDNTLKVHGKIKSPLTDALAILYSKSKNITEEKREWAQKVVDTHSDIEYYQNQLEKLNKEFQELTNPKKEEKKDCCSKK